MSMRKPCRAPIRLATLAVAAGAALPQASRRPGSAEDAAAFTPRPQGGIKGALLPSERSLWTYDAATGKYQAWSRATPRRRTRRTSGAAASR